MQFADGFILVFAVDSKSSFQTLRNLQQQVLRVKDAEIYPMVIVGNKSDLEADRQVTSTGTTNFSLDQAIVMELYAAPIVFHVEAKELAAQFGCRYVETSAKLRHNVEEAFHGVVHEVRKYQAEQHQKDRDLGLRPGSRPQRCVLQ